METLQAQANRVLLQEARKAFGEDLVVDAWFETGAYEFALKGFLETAAEGACQPCELHLFIEFINGNVVELWNSEWGGFNKSWRQS